MLAPNILKFHAKQNMYAEHIRPLGCHVATSDPVQWFSHFSFFFLATGGFLQTSYFVKPLQIK